MQRAAICLVTVGFLALSASGGLRAADRAATPQLPAALRTLSDGGERVLSCQDAQTVRGQNLNYWVGGVVVAQTHVYTGIVSISSSDPYLVRVTLLQWPF